MSGHGLDPRDSFAHHPGYAISATSTVERRFTSQDHPGSVPWPIVFAGAMALPLATCMLPVMILTLFGVLEGLSVLPGALWGAGAAFAVSAAWTSHQLKRRVAEIRVDPEFAAVRSAWDLAHGRQEVWYRVLDVRDYGTWLHATIGLTSYELERRAWPEYDDLVEALRIAYGNRMT